MGGGTESRTEVWMFGDEAEFTGSYGCRRGQT